ncbi:hypothetical protein AS28_01973, partial [Pygoscelis adeliae]
HPPVSPAATSPPSCCQQHSDEVCESCVVKTTLTAENAVEANKLSNNYKVGAHGVGGDTHGCSWVAVMGFLFLSAPPQKKSLCRSTVTCGNVLYLLLFGWWLSLLYVLVAAMMFITVVGAPFGGPAPCSRVDFGVGGRRSERCHPLVPPQTEVPLEGEVILCCYRAVNPYYYKYAVDGINVFAVNLLPLVLVTLVLGYVDSHNHLTSSPVKFTLALLSIMPLSYYIGMAIASISAQSNFAVGAVVNATFGSITELTFYITALIKGSREGNRCYAEIVKSALTGTLVGCVLFVPGLCMVIGGIRHQEQRFNSRSAGVSSALLFLSVGGVFAPTLFSKVYGKLVCGECHNVTQNPLGHYLCHNCHFDLMENNGTLFYSHVQPLVYTVSLLLPAAYLIGLFFTLKTHSHIYDIHISDCHMPGHHHSAVVHWSRWRALVILLLSTLCMSACADLATEHISPILTNSTISQYFIGVTVLAMVPELPEIVNGIQFALQNNLSLSIEIGNCIAVQVCMLQIPILVLFTIFYPTNFTLVFSDLHVYASMFSVVLMNYIFMDGKCDYFQGTVLVMVYFILLAVYFFAPSPSGC